MKIQDFAVIAKHLEDAAHEMHARVAQVDTLSEPPIVGTMLLVFLHGLRLCRSALLGLCAHYNVAQQEIDATVKDWNMHDHHHKVVAFSGESMDAARSYAMIRAFQIHDDARMVAMPKGPEGPQ